MRLFTIRSMSFATSVLAFGAVRAVAGIASDASLSRLSAEADAVVVGSVQASQIGQTVNASISVERVLKGTLMPGSVVLLTWTQPGGGIDVVLPNAKPFIISGHGVFFLRLTGGGCATKL